MEIKTNLRSLRYRHRITLAQLSACVGISGQYISRAELGEIAATARLEQQISSALEAIISARREELRTLEEDYLTCKGRLLRKEVYPNEQ